MDLSTVLSIITAEEAVTKIMDTNNTTLWESTGLPSIYQQVEYIASDGNQYIDTGILASDYSTAITYTLDFKITKWTIVDEHLHFFGAYADGAYSGSFAINASAGNYRTYAGDSSWVAVYKWVNILNQKATLKMSAISNTPEQTTVSLLIDDTEKLTKVSSGGISAANMPEANIYLFNCSGVSQTGPIMQCYGFTISAFDGSVIRDFIPCYHKVNGVIGMYDLISKKFYTNQGTGSFTKGSDI